MHRHGPTRRAFAFRAAGTLAALLAVLADASPALSAQAATPEQLRYRALDLAYNLDHDEAMANLRQAVTLAPDDPAMHRSLASVVWLHMLFRRGAVTVDHYLGSFTRTKVDLKKPPPELDSEFKRHARKAIDLARQRVAARPKDPQAQYDLGSALGLEASYVATVEGRFLAGFNAARHAYDAHEQVLELDASRKGAGLIVGTYRYVVSTLPMAMRWMAYVVGFGGGKDKGIELLEQTAASNSDARADAMFALILVYNRERRFDDAMRTLTALRRLFPKNRLVVLESGATLLRAGRAQQAEAVLNEGMRMFAGEKRARIPGEEALWRYKRGTARAALGRSDAAVEDLRVATAPDAQLWVNGRARVELARLALKQGDRRTAAGEARQAQTLCQQGNDPACVEDATKLLRSAGGS